MAIGPRLSGEERRTGILDAAEALILERRLPLNMDQLAANLGISKALIYAHYPTQAALFSALLERRLEQVPITDAGKGDLKAAAVDQALAYFEHVCEAGPVIHMLLRDRGISANLSHAGRTLRDRAALSLVRRGRKDLKLPAREAVGVFTLIMTLPEEAGSLVHNGQLDRALGRELCREFVEASLEALAPG